MRHGRCSWKELLDLDFNRPLFATTSCPQLLLQFPTHWPEGQASLNIIGIRHRSSGKNLPTLSVRQGHDTIVDSGKNSESLEVLDAVARLVGDHGNHNFTGSKVSALSFAKLNGTLSGSQSSFRRPL